MWLMIAGTPTLKDLSQEARQWLIEHGHAEAAQAVAGRDLATRQHNSTGKRGAGQNKKKRG
jgi:hypothetical protein